MSVPADLGDKLRGFEATLPGGLNKHDRVIALIMLCLEERCCGGRDIVEAIRALGYTPRHIGIMLDDGRGHLWDRDADGSYSTRQVPADT